MPRDTIFASLMRRFARLVQAKEEMRQPRQWRRGQGAWPRWARPKLWFRQTLPPNPSQRESEIRKHFSNAKS